MGVLAVIAVGGGTEGTREWISDNGYPQRSGAVFRVRVAAVITQSTRTNNSVCAGRARRRRADRVSVDVASNKANDDSVYPCVIFCVFVLLIFALSQRRGINS